jgi:insecticidal toxin complex protein TccC
MTIHKDMLILPSNILELDDKVQTLSYEHYYPYGGTAIIAGKDKTQTQL